MLGRWRGPRDYRSASADALGSQLRGAADVDARLAELDIMADLLRLDLARVQGERAVLAAKSGRGATPPGNTS